MEFYGSHVALSELSQYADDTLRKRERLQVEAHLRDCHRCRSDLSFMLKIGEAARSVSHPRPPKELLNRIQASRARGDRVILPADATPPPPRRRGLALVPIALLLASGITVGLSLLSSDARAGSSTLSFEFERADAAPRAVHVEYRGASALAGERQLRLRGRYRTAADASLEDAGVPVEATLLRYLDGAHHSKISLPPSAVYAFFAVEDIAGTTLDTHGGRFWEIVATDEDGFPLFEALRQKFLALEGRDWMGALETARRMTELYPDRAEGWWHRYSYEREMMSGPALEDLTDFHRVRLASLERASLEKSSGDAQQLAALVQYARALGDEVAVQRLYERLNLLLPAHPVAVRHRVTRLIRELAGEPTRLLEALELEWERSGPGDEYLVEAGYEFARRVADSEATLRWTERYLQLRPSASASLAAELAETDALRAAARERLRREIASLDQASDARRGLSRSREQHGRDVALQRAEMLLALGEALAADGRYEAALDTLRRAASGIWDLDLFLRVADTVLALGDEEGAIELYARIAADPLTPVSVADSLRSVSEAAVTEASWEALVQRGERELEGRAVGEAEVRVLPADLSLEDVSGRPVSLRERVGDGPAVIAYWSTLVPPTSKTIDELEWARKKLRDLGIPLLLVVRQAATANIEHFLRELELAVPVLLDPLGQLLGEFDSWLIYEPLVLDSGGRLHLQHGSLVEAMRHAGLGAQTASR